MRVPRKVGEFLTFVGTHANVFDVNHTALGISAAAATAYKLQVGTNQSYYDAQINAIELAKAATNKQQDTTAQTRVMTADLIRTISAFAEQQANPGAVYQLAQIDPPHPQTPAAPPGTPSDFVCTLEPTGELNLAWKCTNPEGTQGTVYEVKRKIGSGAATYIGVTGERKFFDDTVPSSAAVPGITYYITGVRSTQRGSTAQFLVSFGSGGAGLTISSITEAKLAA